MTPEELRAKNENDLKVQIQELREELFKLNLQNKVGQLEKNHRLGELRKDIARAFTILNEKTKKEKK